MRIAPSLCGDSYWCTYRCTVIKHLMAQMRQRRRDQNKICPLGTSLVPYYLQQSPSDIVATTAQWYQQVTSLSVACSVGRLEPS